MLTSNILEGPFFIPEDVTLKGAIILLHGFGSDGADLISLAPALEPLLPKELQNHLAYFAPNGPAPTGMGQGYQWFSDKNWTFRDKPGIQNASTLIHDYIETDVLPATGLNWDKIIVIGFSQGCMTALYAVPRWKEQVGGLVGCSGLMMWDDELKAKTCTKAPALLLHGTEDDVVPADQTVTSAQKLETLGFDVVHHLIPHLGHGLDMTSLKYIAGFLGERLAQA